MPRPMPCPRAKAACHPARATVQELERQLKINEDVLRCLTVKVDQFEQSNSNKARHARDGERKPEGEAAAGLRLNQRR